MLFRLPYILRAAFDQPLSPRQPASCDSLSSHDADPRLGIPTLFALRIPRSATAALPSRHQRHLELGVLALLVRVDVAEREGMMRGRDGREDRG